MKRMVKKKPWMSKLIMVLTDVGSVEEECDRAIRMMAASKENVKLVFAFSNNYVLYELLRVMGRRSCILENENIVYHTATIDMLMKGKV